MKKLFRYEEVANKIESLIAALQLLPGDRVPSVRKVNTELSVSLATVFQAYAILEARGIIISRPRSGYYISSPTTNALTKQPDSKFIALPAEVEVNTMATTMMKNAKERGAINFSILAPANEFIPSAKLNKAVQASIRELASDNFQYPLVVGHTRLLKQIARHSFEWEANLDQEKILVTNGCMEAINLCLDAVTRPGDIVAIESPTYHGILQSLESRGLKALEIAIDPETGLDLNALEAALEMNRVTACVFMPVCNNPIGCSMPSENIKRLLRILGERNIPLIEDDALGELCFSVKRPLPAKAYDSYDNVLYCSSFSKTLAPGFRVGWVSAGKYQPIVERLKFSSNISTAGLLQDSIGRFLDSGHYESHLRKMRNAIQSNFLKYKNSIDKYFPKEIKLAVPKGGLSLWIELPKEVDALALQRMAIEKGIGICPGHIFSTSLNFRHYIRLNYSSFWNQKIDSALQTLGKLIAK